MDFKHISVLLEESVNSLNIKPDGTYIDCTAGGGGHSAAILDHLGEGGRLICVGTTSCRTLESASTEDGIVHAMCDDTGIFIYPGYRFKAVDALITNFHLPQSTLIMLVSAFSNREIVMNAYETAVKEEYRFFSFGDAMFIH